MCAHSCLTGVSVGGEGNQILFNITIMDSYKLICQIVSLHISPCIIIIIIIIVTTTSIIIIIIIIPLWDVT